MEPVAPSPTLPTARPRVWPVFVVFGLAFTAQNVISTSIALVAMLTLAFVRSGHLPSAGELEAVGKGFTTSPYALSGAAGLAALTLAAFAWLMPPLEEVPRGPRLRLGRSTLSAPTLALALVAFLALSLCSDALFALLGLESTGSIGLLNEAFGHASLPARLLGIAVIGVGSGCAEELFFRGYVQTRLSGRWGRWPAIATAAALFAVMHLDLLQGAFAFSVGLFLGWLTDRTGSLRPAMLLHAVNNGLAVATAGLASGLGTTGNALQLAACLAITVGGTFALSRRLPSPRPCG